MDDDFDKLVGELEQVLAKRRTLKDKKKRFELAARRFELEMALIARLKPQRAEAGVEKRRNVRVPCDLSARLDVKEGVVPVRVLDVSGGGVLVEAPSPIAPHSLVSVMIDSSPGLLDEPLVASGEVAWCKQTKAGVAFHRIDESLERRLFDLVLRLLRAQPRRG